MFKPPFSTKKADASPRPPAARVSRPQTTAGTQVHHCPVMSRQGHGVTAPVPKIKLVDPRDVRMKESNIDRRKDIVNTPMATMSNLSDAENTDFSEDTMNNLKMMEFWVFPEECGSVFIDKKSGLAYPNVCLIGINGRQWPLFPGNNRAPDFVYEALEDFRDLGRRFKSKLAKPRSRGNVIFTDPRSTLKAMTQNPELFDDSRLGRPNVYDRTVNSQASNLIRQNREAANKKR